MPYKDKEKQREAQRKWERENRGRGTQHTTWMFVFYPESADPDWREIADSELMLPFCVSPLHDKDRWTARDERKNPKHKAGELKKPHWHAIAEYPHAVSFAQVKEDFEFLGTTNIKYVRDKGSMALYLCHIGSKDKVLYDTQDVQEFGGANWHEWCSEVQDIHATMKEMRVWLRDNVQIHNWEFSDFVDWCDEENDDWSRALDTKCAWAIGNYMDKQRNKRIYLTKLHREMVREQQDELLESSRVTPDSGE